MTRKRLPLSGFETRNSPSSLTCAKTDGSLHRGIAKNRAQLHMLFALANLYMVRRRLMAMGKVLPQYEKKDQISRENKEN
jgi:hypothetical protein